MLFSHISAAHLGRNSATFVSEAKSMGHLANLSGLLVFSFHLYNMLEFYHFILAKQHVHISHFKFWWETCTDRQIWEKSSIDFDAWEFCNFLF